MKIALCLLFVSGAALAAPPRLVTTVEGISEYALDNGLRVLLFPDPSKSTVTVNVTYFVGSRHEGLGETGMAHLLEHMMFKGTPKHPKLDPELEKRGANLNGSTTTDRTNYFETLPAEGDNLAFALEIEADRMVNAKIAAADLKSEFSVVRNEFEMGESAPDRILEERMLQSAYLWHNYGKPTIGSKSDIERVPADSLRAFYKKYYQPDDAMLVVAGKFDQKEALKLVGEKLGRLPRPRRALPATYTVEPQQDGERTVTLRRTGDVQMAGLMYHAAPGASADFVAESALVELLTAQPAGRLYQALVEPGLAAKVHGDAFAWREPGVIEVFADVRTDKPIDKVEAKMIEVVEGMARDAVPADELERWRKKALREIELDLNNSENVGLELSEWAALGDWRLMFLYRDRVKALTAADVQRVAGLLFKRENRTLGRFLPTSKPDRTPLWEQPDASQLMAGYRGNAAAAAGESFAATVENIDKRTERVTLPSGMKLALLSKKTRGGSVQILLHVRAGGVNELRGLTAASSLMSDMVVRGTRKHSFQQIKDELDRLKAELKEPMGMLEGGGKLGAAQFRLETVRESVPAVLALLGEIVREPSFPKDELEKLRKEKLAKLEEQLQEPTAAGLLTLMSHVTPWPKDDPRYLASIPERIERLKAVQIEQLIELHRKLWGGQGASLTLVGDFDAAEVKALAQKEFGAWKAEKPYQRVETGYRQAPVADEVVKTPDKQMAFVGTALPLELRDDDPDYPALLFADFVYGGSERSRIFERLRDKEGLSYSVFSWVDADSLDKSAYFVSAAICAPANAGKAMKGLIEELHKLTDKGLPPRELAENKKTYQAKFNNDLGNDEVVTMLLDDSLHAGRSLAFLGAVNQKVQTLTAADVTGALKKYLRPDALIKVKAGDLK